MGAIYRLTENEDRAIIWQTDRQTDRQTDKVSLSFSGMTGMPSVCGESPQGA